MHNKVHGGDFQDCTDENCVISKDKVIKFALFWLHNSSEAIKAGRL